LVGALDSWDEVDARTEHLLETPPPPLRGKRSAAATPRASDVLERPVVRTPDTAECTELLRYLKTHCWPDGVALGQCLHTSRLLLHLYGGRLCGGWPHEMGRSPHGRDSGYWHRGLWWHHCWLEQPRPGRATHLLDLTGEQFGAPAITSLPVRDASRYRPTHELKALARDIDFFPTRQTVNRWLDGWRAVHG